MKTEALRKLAAQWLEVAERHHPEGVERQAVPQYPEMGLVINQTAASCWRGCADQVLAILDTAPSPEPAAKTWSAPLTSSELAILRELANSERGCNTVAPGWLRLLDEHAAMRVELERLRADKADLTERHGEIVEDAFLGRDAPQVRIAELESALALATEAVAAEALAKVEWLTCTREERALLDAMARLRLSRGGGHVMIGGLDRAQRVDDVLAAELARREAAKAKGET